LHYEFSNVHALELQREHQAPVFCGNADRYGLARQAALSEVAIGRQYDLDLY
jgi:hypothetical protein